eukprot:CAMPEP_0174229932 /NCGR_PEP_ID=MMETSP0417-20130205/798_1 /TAXON_ID=242541 /ORGANISM="Mayorella sp, Strain BSH-02190019" /LENGTH=463 /DNA_ID=CAMNT_0015307541 /DNA_START=23 /DNA_END=1414 /DNA_ORIENTATION=-
MMDSEALTGADSTIAVLMPVVPVAHTFMDSSQYMVNWLSVLALLTWYFAFSSSAVVHAVRDAVRHGVFVRSPPPSADDPINVSKLSPLEEAAQETWSYVRDHMPAPWVVARLLGIASSLLFPFMLVACTQVGHNPDTSVGLFFVQLLQMCFFVFLPTVLFVYRLPSRYHMDLISDVLAIASIWLPWQFQWLPRVICYLTRDHYVYVDDLVIVCLAIYLVTVAIKLRGLGYTYSALWYEEHWGIALLGGFSFIFLVALPIGLPTGFMSFAARPESFLFYLVKVFDCYFQIAIPDEILFRGLLQNVIEQRLDRLLPRARSDDIAELTSRETIESQLDSNGEHPACNTELEAEDEEGGRPQPSLKKGVGPSSSLKERVIGFFWISRNALIALLLSSLIFGLSHLNKPSPGFETPNLMYCFMASLAGLVYGWVWRRTNYVTVSAVAHGTVLWVWWAFFGYISQRYSW